MSNILFLLVGGNPLPAYVVSNFLLSVENKEKNYLPVPDQIYLIHSEGTRHNAQIIKKIIIDKTGFSFNNNITLRNLNYNERNGKEIRNLINNCMQREASQKEISSVHLNYTGGTKPMAVHSFYELSSQNICSKAIFSDMDPKNNKIIAEIKSQDDVITCPIDNDLRAIVKLSVENLLKLHNMEILNSGSTRTINYTRPYSSDVFHGNGRLFENFLLSNLLELKNRGCLEYVNDIRMNIEASHNQRKTEIDLIVIKGYQLFLFSCSVSKPLVDIKHKAFEAIFRAEQLGGEHAQVVVVSLLPQRFTPNRRHRPSTNDPTIPNLQKDLQSFRSARKCSLIGIDEIKGEINGKGTLKEKLQEIINFC